MKTPITRMVRRAVNSSVKRALGDQQDIERPVASRGLSAVRRAR